MAKKLSARTKTSILSSFAVLALVGVAGCGTGLPNPDAQTFNNAPIIDNIVVANPVIYLPTTPVGNGKYSASLAFLLSNKSSKINHLKQILVNDGQGTVNLVGSNTIPAYGALVSPPLQSDSLPSQGTNATIIDTADNLRNGLNIKLTFVFDTGQGTITTGVMQKPDDAHTSDNQPLGDPNKSGYQEK